MLEADVTTQLGEYVLTTLNCRLPVIASAAKQSHDDKQRIIQIIGQ